MPKCAYVCSNTAEVVIYYRFVGATVLTRRDTIAVISRPVALDQNSVADTSCTGHRTPFLGAGSRPSCHDPKTSKPFWSRP